MSSVKTLLSYYLVYNVAFLQAVHPFHMFPKSH